MTADQGLHPLDRHLVVVGMMAAGKTTLGRELAARLAVPYDDSDVTIEDNGGVTGRTLAAASGVESLHDIEADVLLQQLAKQPPAVITAAASVIDSERCRAALHDAATVCWIDVPVDVLMVRVNHGDHRRPMTLEELTARHEYRLPWLRAISDVRVDGLAPMEQRVAAVLAHLESGV